METYAIEQEDSLPKMTATDRRRYPRTLSRTRCTLKTRASVQAYDVRNLSVCGALLTDGPMLADETPVDLLLHVPLYPDIRVQGRVIRRGRDDEGKPFIGIEFNHHGDESEDHIQAALLSEIERSETSGRIADILA